MASSSIAGGARRHRIVVEGASGVYDCPMSRYHFPRSQSFPAVLKFTEKHGDRLFLIHGEEDFQKACLKIALERVKDGYWYPGVEQLKKEREEALGGVSVEGAELYVALSEDELNALPEALREKAKELLLKLRRKRASIERHYAQELETAELAESLLEKPDLQIAADLIADRRDYQYEGYDLEGFESLGDLDG